MKKYFIALIGICILFSINSAWGDATIETTAMTGGIKGMGATEATHIQRYQGDKMTESISSKFTGALLSRVMSGTENITITRVDKGVYWIIDPKSRTYEERPIVPLQLKPEEQVKKESKPTSRVTKSEFNVKKTGASETINGFRCQEYLVTWLIEIEDLETKAKTRFLMENHLWNTPKTSTIMKLQADEQKFHKALAKKIGVISPKEAKQMGMGALAAMTTISDEEMKKGMSRVKNELAKIEGYPIRTSLGWSAEGDAKTGEGRKEEASEERQSEKSPGLSGGFGGMLSNIAGRIVQKKGEDKAADDKDASFFSSVIEVKSIDSKAVTADTFEIPKGFQKKGE